MRYLLVAPQGDPIELYADRPCTIGRTESCEVPLLDEDASRRHAEVLWTAGGFILRDLGSRNGTVVNGQTVVEKVLADGDEIRIGSHLFSYVIDTGRKTPTKKKGNGAAVAQADVDPKKRVGPYVIEHKIGNGSMGAVYKARVEETGETVALKVLPPKAARDTVFLKRFEREAKVGLGLRHSNILRTHDVGLERGLNYIAIEYAEGGSARALLDKSGALGEMICLRIIRQIAQGLQHAHDQGVVHRDLKPENILFNAKGKAKICDFGLVHVDKDTALTQKGETVGTPHYIAPEQARGDVTLDARADIYSLGATLYHMSTGQTPFAGDNGVIIMKKHLHEDPEPPAEVNPKLSAGFSALIMRMMSKNRDDRQASATELDREAEAVMTGGK
jgi:serine/threonine protein kinase